MTKDWAEQHEDHGYYYSEEPGQCENPHCGHYPIYHRRILRHHLSGEVVEIGTHCYQRWKQVLGLGTDPWFDEYEKRLQVAAMERPGRMVPALVKREIREDARREWLLKQAKQEIIHLERFDMPLQNFNTRDEAEKYAQEHGGYCSGTITMSGTKCWLLYVNPIYKGEY